jgi:hypothetical protein
MRAPQLLRSTRRVNHGSRSSLSVVFVSPLFFTSLHWAQCFVYNDKMVHLINPIDYKRSVLFIYMRDTNAWWHKDEHLRSIFKC